MGYTNFLLFYILHNILLLYFVPWYNCQILEIKKIYKSFRKYKKYKII